MEDSDASVISAGLLLISALVIPRLHRLRDAVRDAT